MQNRRSYLATTLRGRISLHRDMRAVRLGGSLREITAIRRFENTGYLWPCGQPVGGLAGKFRHYDQAFSGRPRRGEWFAFGRTCLARLDGGGADSGSGARVLPCFRRIVQSRSDYGSARQTVDVRLSRHFTEALPLGLPLPSRDD